MRVPLSWLSEYIDLPTTDIDDLSYVFSMLGLGVEGVEVLEPQWSDVVVGEVVAIEAHPDADRIRVCQVDRGSGPEQIICGAWNFETGARVAVASPGSVLAGGLEIGRRNIRGVDSNGMICSERELGLGDDHAGILVLDDQATIGTPLIELVELPDIIFDLDITPNRPDAMSLVGVARDLAAWYDIEYRVPEVPLVTVSGATSLGVVIDDPVGCRRFTAREIQGVVVGPSPLKVRQRLQKMGARSISNVVDVTNYVMFELGHPLHAFDADTIAGGRLTIRRAGTSETLETLDGTVRQLHPDDLIIYDSEGPTSMSGTMGGARSEVSTGTTRVLMEAASWDPPTIMHMWRRHGLRSEAATRFERGVDPGLSDVANRRAAAMVGALAGGRVLEGGVDVVSAPIQSWVVDLRPDDVTRTLGPEVATREVGAILERLGMTVAGEGPWAVTVPTYRPDLTRAADLVEEIARIHGFDSFEPTLPRGPIGGLTPQQRRQRVLSSALTGAGLSQAINLPFVGVDTAVAFGYDPGSLLEVRNPLRDEEARLRPSLLPGLLQAAAYNLSHGTDSVALFEIGRVFMTGSDPTDPRLPLQPERVGWVMTGGYGLERLDAAPSPVDGAVSLAVWATVSDRLGLTGVKIEQSRHTGFHAGRCAAISVSGNLIGHVGEMSPGLARRLEVPAGTAIAELDLIPLLQPVDPPLGRAPSQFPPFDFDLSFSLDKGSPVGSLIDATRAAAADLVESVRVFDEYFDDKGSRSVAIHYRLRASDRTLTAEEAAHLRTAMIDAASTLGAKLRGA